jgi:hypothetical protein
VRTAKEIVEHILNEKQVIDFRPEVVVEYLTFEEAKPLLKPDARPEDWPPHKPLTREQVLSDMCAYMDEYGWPKALNHRGLSANRTVQKMQVWAFMLGDDIDVDKMHYENYGAPILKFFCEKYGFPIPDCEEARRMAEGLPCTPSCEEGCGQ